MVYGYIRVSTDHQTTENQRFEIFKSCEKQEIARRLRVHRDTLARFIEENGIV